MCVNIGATTGKYMKYQRSSGFIFIRFSCKSMNRCYIRGCSIRPKWTSRRRTPLYDIASFTLLYENFLWQVALRWIRKLLLYGHQNIIDWQNFSNQSHSWLNNSFRSRHLNICPNISFGTTTILEIIRRSTWRLSSRRRRTALSGFCPELLCGVCRSKSSSNSKSGHSKTPWLKISDFARQTPPSESGQRCPPTSALQ